MDNIFIYKELKSVFYKHIDDKTKFSDIQVQKASWKFNVYPSTSQIHEIQECRENDDPVIGMEFYEFCLLIATIKHAIINHTHSFKIKPQGSFPKNQKARWDVFLGGACNPTTWRLDVAIPFLKEKQITFYNPQVSQWDSSLIEIENMAKECAKVLLFVLDLQRTRGIASLVEAAYLSGQGRNLVLVVPSEQINPIKNINGEPVDENEFQSINRSYLMIADLVQRQGIPLFRNVHDALKATRICIISKSMVQNLTDIDGVVPVKHSYVNVSIVVKTLQLVFNSIDSQKLGTINHIEAKLAVQKLFDQEVPLISLEKTKFTFADLCIEYSVLLLNSLQNSKEQVRSNSEVNFKMRCSSLENLDKLDEDLSLKSSINIKHQIDEICLEVETVKEPSKMSFLCDCFKGKNKLASCIFRLFKRPLKGAVIQPLGESFQPLNLVPKILISEEKYDVYLGGTCGSSNWRERIAKPRLESAGCTFYDPKIYASDWSRKSLPIEAEARENSKVLVYVITNECTSTATLVEVSHFIGQGKKILLFVQMLANMSSPPTTPMSQFLQSSCSFPLSSLNPSDSRSLFSSLKTAESATTGYQSISDTNTSQMSFPPISSKLSNSDAGFIKRSQDYSELAISMNNISKINALSHESRMDHNRGRKYLIDLAKNAKVPILSSVEETISKAIEWSQKINPSRIWTSKSDS